MVLGGRGFLGTHLVGSMLAQGMSVRIFDRHPPSPALPDPRLEVVRGDLTSCRDIEPSLQGIDVVYHLISTTVPSTSNADLVADVESNLIGSLRLLEAMKRMDVGRIVFISSGGTVYGNPSKLPVSESDPVAPLCSYGIVKVAIENYLRMFSNLHGMTAVILRVSNAYGLHQHRIGVQGVIPTFFRRVMAGEPIEIWGDGSAVRDYIYASDVIVAMLRAGSLSESATFNIGSGIGHSLNDVLDIVCKVMGRRAEVNYFPHRNYDVHRIVLDISKAGKELEWKPSFTLEQGCLDYWKLINENGQI